jgi:hypothetical protein
MTRVEVFRASPSRLREIPEKIPESMQQRRNTDCPSKGAELVQKHASPYFGYSHVSYSTGWAHLTCQGWQPYTVQ